MPGHLTPNNPAGGTPTVTWVNHTDANNSTGLSTLSITTTAVGQVVVMCIVFGSAYTGHVTGISQTGVTWGGAAAASSPYDPPSIYGRVEIWIGTVTASGTNSATVTYSSTNVGSFTELSADVFSSSYGNASSWAAVANGANGSASAVTTVTWPSLTTTGSGEMYIGASYIAVAASAGSTSGFTYEITTASDCVAYNTTLASAPTAYQPTCPCTSGVFNTAAVIIQAT
jgi:hypothetical protein